MSKPEDIPPEVWDYGAAVVHVYCGCAPGRPRTNGTTHHDSCWKQVEDHARAILAAEKRGEEREREAIEALLAHGAPHSPRRYIYDNTADRRIWACDQLDAAIRARSAP